ncbi:MAG: hypothetical protein ACI4KR_09255 [Ruminiclostridium sp.]
MLVGDIIYNDDFNCNCDIEVHKYTAEIEQGRCEDTLIYNNRSGFSKPPCVILDMKVKYITVIDNTLFIEATEED